MAFSRFQSCGFCWKRFVQKLWHDYWPLQPSWLLNELSIDKRDSNGFISTRLVHRDSDSSYNTTDLSLILIAERISVRLWIGDLFSQSTYVRMYVRTCVHTWWVTLRNVTRIECRYIPDTIGIGHMWHHRHKYMCVIYGDTFRYAQLREMCRWCSLAMEMEVGDDGTAGPLRLGYYKHQTIHASTAPA